MKKQLDSIQKAHTTTLNELKDTFGKEIDSLKVTSKDFITSEVFDNRLSLLEEALNKRVAAALNDIKDVRTETYKKISTIEASLKKNPLLPDA